MTQMDYYDCQNGLKNKKNINIKNYLCPFGLYFNRNTISFDC